MNLYNTCFVLQNEKGNFLVDCGGSIEIVKRLKEKDIKLEEIKHIFISHRHTDHILGLIWIFKRFAVIFRDEDIVDKIKIYCNDEVYKAIKEIAKYVLPLSLVKKVYEVIDFVVLKDKDKYVINGVLYEFFDILAKGTKQFGFEFRNNGKRFVFLGDEPLNSLLNERVRGSDYVTHEAFCLDGEKDIFHPYEKNHSTALSTAKVMAELGVRNLILYHTEESHENKKELYTKEADSVFDGNVIVPEDLEEILLG